MSVPAYPQFCIGFPVLVIGLMVGVGLVLWVTNFVMDKVK